MRKFRRKVTITLPPVEQNNINFDYLQEGVVCLSDNECEGNYDLKSNTVYYNKIKNSFHVYDSDFYEIKTMVEMACYFSLKNNHDDDDYFVVTFSSKGYIKCNIVDLIKEIDSVILIDDPEVENSTDGKYCVVFKLTNSEKNSDDEHASMYAECVDSFFSIDSSLITNKYKSFKLWLKPFMNGVYDTLLSVSETFISFSNKAFFFYVQLFFADSDSKVSDTKLEFLKGNIAQIFFMVMFSFVFGAILGLIAMH